MTRLTKETLNLLEKLAPEKPMNQDELGGCVWCGGSGKEGQYGYCTPDPACHTAGCPWVAARALLAANGR